MLKNYIPIVIVIIFFSLTACNKNILSSYIGQGWSSNSINAVKFRKHALTTFGNMQFVGYYNEFGYLVLGKRKLNSKTWTTYITTFRGNVKDAHNSISLAVDGNGYLHVSWDHHNTKLRYAKSKMPLGLELGAELIMTGKQEDKVTYPEFYNLPNGNVLFFYRSGESGSGNLVINSYDVVSKKWTQLQSNLIDGENTRSAYWQACVDSKGTIHISWVWRETWDVETNHDMCYARSNDGGKTWETSKGEKYLLPITLASAEYACKIPQKSNLINQTSISFDKNSNPYIATYWNENGLTQYQIVYLEAGNWKRVNTGFRNSTFNLGGGGTKKIPISRPDIFIDNINNKTVVSILFRDEERGNKVSLAYSSLNKISNWHVTDLSQLSVGDWEPNFDIALWNNKKKLHVFMQNVLQIDGEGIANQNASSVNVLEIKYLKKIN